MTATEETRTEILKDGETKIIGRRQNYKTTLTLGDDRIRLSSQYSGLPVYEPPFPEDQMLKARQYELRSCPDTIKFCWERTNPSVPWHYSINSEGRTGRIIVDDVYIAELKKWMNDRYSDLEGYEDYVAKMLEYLQSDQPDLDFDPRQYPLQENLRQFHGKQMKKGEIYTNYYLPLRFSRGRYFLPNFQHDLVSKELQYLGKVPCNEDDTKMSCAHLKYRMTDLDPTNLMHDETSVQISVDLILEPQTLLLHNVDYESLSRTIIGGDFSRVSASTHNLIDIDYRYEDLPE